MVGRRSGEGGRPGRVALLEVVNFQLLRRFALPEPPELVVEALRDLVTLAVFGTNQDQFRLEWRQ